MYHSGRHPHPQQSLGLMTMINKPPKPPSWRDFVPDQRPHSKKSHTRDLEFSDLTHQRSSSDGEAIGRSTGHAHPSASAPSSKSTHHKKHKSKENRKLHRTRSQTNISQSELPEVQHMTISLADAPKETGFFRGGSRLFDAQIYLDDNAKRCEKWLKDVHASQPLTDIAFSQGSGDEVEIPEENWEDLERVKSSPVLASTSGSDIDSVSVCGCGRRDKHDRDSKTRVKNRRYSDTRVPHRTRDLGMRAQTLPTPGKLKRLAKLTESQESLGATTGGKAAHNEDQGQQESQQKRKSTELSSSQKSLTDVSDNAKQKDSGLRKVSEIDRVPAVHEWQVTEIDQNLLIASSLNEPESVRDASTVTCVGTTSELDRKLTDSFENLLDASGGKTNVSSAEATSNAATDCGQITDAENTLASSGLVSDTTEEVGDTNVRLEIESPDPGGSETVGAQTSIQVNSLEQIDFSLEGSHL